MSATEVDGRSDIYALGTVLYECVAGEPPFTGEAQSVLYRDRPRDPAVRRGRGAPRSTRSSRRSSSRASRRTGSAGRSAPARWPRRCSRYRPRLRESERGAAGRRRSTAVDAGAAAGAGAARGAEKRARRAAAAPERGGGGGVPVRGRRRESRASARRGSSTRSRASRGRASIRVLHGRFVEQDRVLPLPGLLRRHPGVLPADGERQHARPRRTSPTSRRDLVSPLPDARRDRGDPRRGGQRRRDATRAARPRPENRTQVFELLARTLTRIAGGKPLVLAPRGPARGRGLASRRSQYIVRRLGPTPDPRGRHATARREVGPRHPLTRMLEGFRGDRRFAADPARPALARRAPRFARVARRRRRRARDGLAQRLYDGTRGEPLLHQGARPLAASTRGASRGRDGRVDALRRGRALGRRAAGRRSSRRWKAASSGCPRSCASVLAIASVLGKTLRRPRPRGARAGGARSRTRSTGWSRRGSSRRTRESRGDVLHLLERDRPRRALRRRSRRRKRRIAAPPLRGAARGAARRPARAGLPAARPPLLAGRRAREDGGVRPAPARGSRSTPSAPRRPMRVARDRARRSSTTEWEGDRGPRGRGAPAAGRAQRMAGNIEGALREAATAVARLREGGRTARPLGGRCSSPRRRPGRRGAATRRGALGRRRGWRPRARPASTDDAARSCCRWRPRSRTCAASTTGRTRYLEEAEGMDARRRERSRGSRGARRAARWSWRSPTRCVAIEPAVDDQRTRSEVLGQRLRDARRHGPEREPRCPACARSGRSLDGGDAASAHLRRGVLFSDGHAADRGGREGARSRRRSAGAQATLPAALSAVRGVTSSSRPRRRRRAGSSGAGAIGSGARDPARGAAARSSRRSSPTAAPRSSHGRRRRHGQAGSVGTGPFRSSSARRDRVVLERNPGYWRSRERASTRIEFRSALERERRSPRATAPGEIDLARDLLPEDLEEILRDPRLRRGLVEAPKKNTYFVALQLPRAALAAQRRRCAGRCAGAVRASDLVWRALGRFAEPATGLIPPGMLGHDPGRAGGALDPRGGARAARRRPGSTRRCGCGPRCTRSSSDRYAALIAALSGAWGELGVEVADRRRRHGGVPRRLGARTRASTS